MKFTFAIESKYDCQSLMLKLQACCKKVATCKAQALEVSPFKSQIVAPADGFKG